MTILITGAAGNLGRAVTRSVAALGKTAVLGSHTPELLTGPEPVRRLDYDDPNCFAAALQGVTAVFVIAPLADAHSPERVAPFLEAAVAAGVRHLVVNSAFEAEYNDDFTLRHIERDAEASGLPWTHIRSQWYMTSLTTGFFVPQLRAGEIALPTESAGTAWVDTRDVADVVATILAKPSEHVSSVYKLTGPEAPDWHVIAELCSKHYGHPVRYLPVTEEEYRDRCLSSGIPADTTEFLVKLFAAVRAGFAEPITDTVERITGHPARSLRQFFADSAG